MSNRSWIKQGAINIFLCLIILFISLYGLNLFPFSNQMIVTADFASQYFPFMQYLREHPFDIASYIYSFNNGLGGEVISLYAYYLASPFNLLIFLFSKSMVLYGTYTIIGVKILASVFTMTFYLNKRYKLVGIKTSIISLGYALGGFVALNWMHFMWLDVFVWFPLVIYGLQQLIDHRNTKLYQISLLLLLFSSYYMGYMICIFLILYFFYWNWRKNDNQPWKEILIKCKESFIQFVTRSIAVALMLGVIFLPTIIGMLNSSRMDGGVSQSFQYPLSFNIASFAGTGIGLLSVRTPSYPPALYIGMLLLILAIAYFFNSNISKRQKKIKLTFLIVLFLFLFIAPLSLVFTMFKETMGIPFRFAYLISFILIECAAEMIIHYKNQYKSILISGSILLIYFLFLFVTKKFKIIDYYYYLDTRSLLTTIVAITFAIISGLLLLYSTKKIIKIIVLFIVMGELSINMMSTNSCHKYEKNQDIQQYINTAKKVKQSDNVLERADISSFSSPVFSAGIRQYNIGMMSGLKTSEGYTSTLGQEQANISNNLGLFQLLSHYFSLQGQTSLVSMLCNMTEIPYLTDGKYSGIKPGYGKGGAILFNGYINPTSSNKFKNQNKIAHALGGETIFNIQKAEDVKQSLYKYEATYVMNYSGALYLQVPDEKFVEWNQEYVITINGVEYPVRPRSQRLIYLKGVAKGDIIKLHMTSRYKNNWNNVRLAIWDTPAFDVMQKSVKAANVKIDSPTTVTTSMTSPDDHHWLMLSIPYHKGWTVKVNGRKEEAKEIAGGFIGIRLHKGKNKIEAHYQSWPLKIGFYITILGIIFNLWLNHLDARFRLNERQEDIRRRYRYKK